MALSTDDYVFIGKATEGSRRDYGRIIIRTAQYAVSSEAMDKEKL